MKRYPTLMFPPWSLPLFILTEYYYAKVMLARELIWMEICKTKVNIEYFI